MNANKKEVKILIKTFAKARSMIYVAGLLLKILDEVSIERSPRIPKEARSGIGYIKISNNHDIIVYGGIWNALRMSVEALRLFIVTEIPLERCEKVREYRIYGEDFNTGALYGDVAVLITICKVRESVSDYDWYWYYIIFKMVPGRVAYNSS